MKFIEVVGKKFKLASRFARIFAFLIDGMLVAGVLSILVFLFDAMGAGIGPSLIRIGLLSALLWTLGPKTKMDEDTTLPLFQMLIIGLFGPWANYSLDTLLAGGTAIGAALLFFMDGLNDGQGPGKKLLSLQVIRLKNGKPCTAKDSFIRRLTSIFQPIDLFWTFGKQRQRMGDKLVETVVVKLTPELEQLETEADPEKILEHVIDEMTNRLSEARQKVDASIGVEKLFQNAYEGAVAQAEQWEERAVISLKAGREDLARKDLEKRNEYRQLADQYKTQWEEQKQIVLSLSNLFEHLQQKMTAAEGKKAAVVAKHRNVDAETHLREMLKEIQDSEAFETIIKMEQDATEAATLAKAAAEVDVAYQDAKLAYQFAGYAEEVSLEKDLTELKTKLQE